MVRVFVNGAGVDVAGGAPALEAVRAFDAAAAAGVEQGTMVITDSRGLPAPADLKMEAGAILRLIPARARAAHAEDQAQDDA